MVDGIGVGRLDKREIVHHARGVREQIADPGSGLPMLTERPVCRSNGKTGLTGGHSGQLLVASNRGGHVFVELQGKVRLVIKKIDLWRSARHEEINRALRFGREVWKSEIVLSQSCLRVGT